MADLAAGRPEAGARSSVTWPRRAFCRGPPAMARTNSGRHQLGEAFGARGCGHGGTMPGRRGAPRLGELAGAAIGGVDSDTAGFTVQTIRRWWQEAGRTRHPKATRLVVTANGGSNSARMRLCKRELQCLASELGIAISMHPPPPGTSKRNTVEHRLCSFISQTWPAKPLVSTRVISATTTKPGLTLRCELDPNAYPRVISVSDQAMEVLNITRDPFHGEWNYTIPPHKPEGGTVVLWRARSGRSHRASAAGHASCTCGFTKSP